MGVTQSDGVWSCECNNKKITKNLATNQNLTGKRRQHRIGNVLNK